MNDIASGSNFFPSHRCKVLIVGSGPAGLATALFLLQQKPNLAGQIIALEKRKHPRPKVCAGGLIPKTLQLLDELGLTLDVPSVAVRRGAAITEVGVFQHERKQPLCTVVRRDEFDAWLAEKARQRGLILLENTPAQQVFIDEDGAYALTTRGVFKSEVLVGADGSSSKVRASLFGAQKRAVGRALTVDLPVEVGLSELFSAELYQFDFRCIRWGVPGYSWAFPCLINGRPHVNIGVYDQRLQVGPHAPSVSLLEVLHKSFRENLIPYHSTRTILESARSAPIRWYDPEQRFVRGRALLVGDAAGVDPMMGEGISVALEHGRLAADAISRFLEGDKRGLESYDGELRYGAIGRKLNRLALAARLFYSRHHGKLLRLIQLSSSMRELALDWYNGTDHMDEMSIGVFLLKWFVGAIV